MWTPLLEIPTDRLVVFAVAVGKPLQAPAKQVKPLCFGLLLLSQATLVKRGPSSLDVLVDGVSANAVTQRQQSAAAVDPRPPK
jgi:hypothetical protein